MMTPDQAIGISALEKGATPPEASRVQSLLPHPNEPLFWLTLKQYTTRKWILKVIHLQCPPTCAATVQGRRPPSPVKWCYAGWTYTIFCCETDGEVFIKLRGSIVLPNYHSQKAADSARVDDAWTAYAPLCACGDSTFMREEIRKVLAAGAGSNVSRLLQNLSDGRNLLCEKDRLLGPDSARELRTSALSRSSLSCQSAVRNAWCPVCWSNMQVRSKLGEHREDAYLEIERVIPAARALGFMAC